MPTPSKYRTSLRYWPHIFSRAQGCVRGRRTCQHLRISVMPVRIPPDVDLEAAKISRCPLTSAKRSWGGREWRRWDEGG